MKRRFFQLHCAVLIVAVVFLAADVFDISANAQRNGGGSSSSGSSHSSSSSSSRSSSSSSRSSSSSSRGSSGSSSSRSSSSRSSGSSSGSNRSSGNSSRGNNSSSSTSTSSSTSNSSTSSRSWGHRHEQKDNSSRGAKRDKTSDSASASPAIGGSLNSRSNRDGRNRGADSTGALTIATDDRARLDDPEGRRGGGRGRDRDRDRNRFGPGTRFRGGDRAEWHRHECERGRYFYPTRIYYASNYNNYSYGPSAYDRGYEDGLLTGANDAWRGQSFDPERSHFYKHGAGGFLSVFGGPSWYKAAYRDGFLRGYEEGFQNYTSYFVDGKFRR